MNWMIAYHLNLQRKLACGCEFNIIDYEGAVFIMTAHKDADLEHKIQVINDFKSALLREIKINYFMSIHNA